MNIKGKFVTLRAMREDDADMIVDMFNDPEIENLVIGWAFPLSKEQHLEYFKKANSDNRNFRFVIETKEDGAVGIAILTNIDWKNRTASHGIKLANKKNRARGIGTDTVMAIERYAFEELGLHRLDVNIFPFNEASKHLYLKCGWQQEGLKRSCVFKKGEWRDELIGGILDSDYKELIKKNNYWNE